APRCRWIDMQLREHVLELIAKSESSACLVEAGAGAHAGADRLVGEPAVDHEVKGGIRRRDLDAAQPLYPAVCTCAGGSFNIRRILPRADKLLGMIQTVALPENKAHFCRSIGGNIEVDLKGRAAIVVAGRRSVSKIPV